MTVSCISLFADLQWPLITYRIMCQIFNTPCPFYHVCSLTHLAMNFAIFKTYFLQYNTLDNEKSQFDNIQAFTKANTNSVDSELSLNNSFKLKRQFLDYDIIGKKSLNTQEKKHHEQEQTETTDHRIRRPNTLTVEL